VRILVTGGAGFIGSHVTERLVRDGHSVTVLDDLSTGRRANLEGVLGDVEFLHGDVADASITARAVSGRDAVVHLAAVASVQASVAEPLRTHRTNLSGSVQLFEAAARSGVARVVYASSAAVYGEATDLPIGEDAPKRPMSPYAVDKLAGEYYLAHYRRSGAFAVDAFRFFNVYGPRQDPSSPYSGVISVFLDRARRRQGVTIYGDGKQTRDFVYVQDLVDVVTAAVTSGGATGQDDASDDSAALNLASGRSVDLLELVNAVNEAAGLDEPLRVTFAPARQGDIGRSAADVTLLEARYGAVPSTPLAVGLAHTYRSLT
jgi:UDP-glucose 4-epimerase